MKAEGKQVIALYLSLLFIYPVSTWQHEVVYLCIYAHENEVQSSVSPARAALERTLLFLTAVEFRPIYVFPFT